MWPPASPDERRDQHHDADPAQPLREADQRRVVAGDGPRAQDQDQRAVPAALTGTVDVAVDGASGVVEGERLADRLRGQTGPADRRAAIPSPRAAPPAQAARLGPGGWPGRAAPAAPAQATGGATPAGLASGQRMGPGCDGVKVKAEDGQAPRSSGLSCAAEWAYTGLARTTASTAMSVSTQDRLWGSLRGTGVRMAELPSGTVTFLFTDVEGSTARWERQPEAMRVALARHDALIRAAIVEHGGHVVKTVRRRLPRRVRSRPRRRHGGPRCPAPASGRAVGRGRPVAGADGAPHGSRRGAGRRLLRPGR